MTLCRDGKPHRYAYSQAAEEADEPARCRCGRVKPRLVFGETEPAPEMLQATPASRIESQAEREARFRRELERWARKLPPDELEEAQP